MIRHKEKDIIKVRELRKIKKYSFAKLERITGIPATTIRNWCSDIDVGSKRETLLATNKRKRQELIESEAGAIHAINLEDAGITKVLAALLYWCEGSKYPASTAVTMVNSDPDLLRIFIHLLRCSFPLDESKFSVHVQIHSSQEFSKIREFWSRVLSIPKSRFMKPTITQAHGNKHRNQYFGTCTVKYQDYRILLKLTGIYGSFAEKFGRVA